MREWHSLRALLHRVAQAPVLRAAPVAVRQLPAPPHAVASSGVAAAAGLAEAAAAAAAAAAVLALLGGGPVLAKEKRGKSRYEVYVWGRSEAIPGGAPGDVLWPKHAEWFDSNEAGWAKIAFGPNFGAALDRKGRLFVWGEVDGQDPVGPVPVEPQGEARGHGFADVQCSADKIFALTSRGHVLFFEDVPAALKARATEGGSSPSAEPKSLPLPGRYVPSVPQPGALSMLTGGGGIKSMDIGLEHGCFVSRRGDVYCVGGNEWGQCGVKPPRQKGPMGGVEERARVEAQTPVKVEMPAWAGPIVEVAVGGRHTLVRDAAGNTFAFGDDRRIQLGLGDTRSQTPDVRKTFGALRQHVLGGREAKQEVRRGVSYRYYDPHMQYSPVPTSEPEVYNRPPYPPPSFLACGEDFTLAVHRDSPDWYAKDQETNVVLCCGENAEGQCGRGLQEQQQPWATVRLPKRSRTEAVSCGQAHCAALLSNGDLYAWGASLQGQLGNGKRAVKSRPTRIGLEPPPQEGAEPVNVSREGEPPEWHAPKVEFRRFPGKIVSVSCGFRNTAVICEVPADE